jgi:hypothetical protein
VKLAVHGVDGCVNHFATAAKKSQYVDKFLVVAAQTCANDFGIFAVLTQRFDGLPQRNGPVCINGCALLGFRETRFVTGSFSGDGRLTDGAKHQHGKEYAGNRHGWGGNGAPVNAA